MTQAHKYGTGKFLRKHEVFIPPDTTVFFYPHTFTKNEDFLQEKGTYHFNREEQPKRMIQTKPILKEKKPRIDPNKEMTLFD